MTKENTMITILSLGLQQADRRYGCRGGELAGNLKKRRLACS